MRVSSVRKHAGRARLVAAVSGCAAAGVLLAGCGGTVGYSKGTGDRANGKELFTQKCGSCHTLADAGTTGQVGPNLDDAFYQSRQDGLGQSAIVQVVRGQIAYPVTSPSAGGPGMPADIVTGQDAEDVASYVAAVAGTSGANASASSGATTTAPAATTPVTNGAGAMPSFEGQLSTDEIAAVAAYVSSVAGS